MNKKNDKILFGIQSSNKYRLNISLSTRFWFMEHFVRLKKMNTSLPVADTKRFYLQALRVYAVGYVTWNAATAAAAAGKETGTSEDVAKRKIAAARDAAKDAAGDVAWNDLWVAICGVGWIWDVMWRTARKDLAMILKDATADGVKKGGTIQETVHSVLSVRNYQSQEQTRGH